MYVSVQSAIDLAVWTEDGLSVTCGRATATVGNSVEILALASTIREEYRYRYRTKANPMKRTATSNVLSRRIV